MNERSRLGLLANPGSRRALGFAAACRTMGFPEPRLIPWEEYLSARFDPEEAFAGMDALRIETPAENDAVERQLLGRGATACEAEGLYPVLAEDACASLPPDQGELRFQRQWYLGWREVLVDISRHCKMSGCRPMSHPEEIAVLFDKVATRDVLEKCGVPVPPSAGICSGFDDLISRMDQRGWHRVFLKPCHGSSATGVMAIARNRSGEWRATTSAVLTHENERTRIWNSKGLRQLRDPDEIRSTVDAVCRQRALIERWFPKATLGGKAFDLRVVAISGSPAHVAVRTSHFPITNLHLRNSRGDLELVQRSLGAEKWRQSMEIAAAAAACFPGCHTCGVDLMIAPGGRGHAVAEVNAFGDLLHHERWEGMDTWEAALSRWPRHGGA